MSGNPLIEYLMPLEPLAVGKIRWVTLLFIYSMGGLSPNLESLHLQGDGEPRGYLPLISSARSGLQLPHPPTSYQTYLHYLNTPYILKQMKAGRKPKLDRNQVIYELGKKGLTYKEIGDMFKITRQRACQIFKDVDKSVSISLTP